MRGCWAIGTVVAGLAACSTAAVAAEGTLKIGAIYLDAQGYYAGVQKGVRDRAKALGRKLELIETNARGDVSRESSFIDTVAAAGVDALILSPVSTQGSVRSIRRASQAGIPIVCYNTCVADEDIEKYVFAYAVGDPVEFGRKIGAVAGQHFLDAGMKGPKIGVVNCEQFEVCVARRKGFEAALKAKVPGATIVANQEGTELDKAISTGQQILAGHGDIDALFGESGGATLGAVKAVRDSGRAGKVIVFGSDMTSEIADELMKNDVLKGEVDISGKAMGALALDLAIKAINGEKLSDKIVQAPIEVYVSSEAAQDWKSAHPDGLP